jgi:hypothetical protein
VRRLFVVGAAVVLAACVRSSAPKTLAPSVEQTVPGAPDLTFQAALSAISAQGLPLREADPTSRVIQTNFVDMAEYDPHGASQYPASERAVRFKILIAPNPNGPGSAIAIFGLYSPFRTGYVTSERNERTIPKDHPGMTVVRHLRDDIVKAVGGG